MGVRGARTAIGVLVVAVGLSTSVGVAHAATAKAPSPQVDLTGVVVKPTPAGNGVPQRSATDPTARQPLPGNYAETEFLLEGKAAAYKGPAAGPVKVEATGNPFVTRVLVRAPKSSADFSGTVWVEPLNTSSGGDSDAVWRSVAPLIADRGDAWIGVTVRAGQVPRLQAFDAARYADLSIENNGDAWDMLRDVGALVKTNSPQGPLPDLKVKQVYVAGYSQSGSDAATLASAFNEVTRLRDGSPVFDGYLVGGRGGFLTPLQSSASIIPSFETAKPRPVDSPLIDFEAQSNVEGTGITVPTSLLVEAGVAGADKITTPTSTYTVSGGAYVRRPDTNTKTDRFRLVEVPGSPHAAGAVSGCDGNGSTFPVGAYFAASGANLVRWAEKGKAPASIPRIALATSAQVSTSKTDQYGNALGGLRSPLLDVPISKYDARSTGTPSCWQTGNETALPTDTLKQLYGDAQGYMTKFTKALDAAIKNGTLLAIDRQTILDLQQAKANAAFGAG